MNRQRVWKWAVAITLVAAACVPNTDDNNPPPIERSTDTRPIQKPVTSQPQLPVVTRTDLYIKVIREEYPLQTFGVDDDSLVAIGKGWCDIASVSVTGEVFWETTVSIVFDVDPNQAEFYGFTVGAALSAFCPEYTEFVP